VLAIVYDFILRCPEKPQTMPKEEVVTTTG
jgi:hypothetical protein